MSGNPDEKKFQSLRGMRDILPEDAAIWRHVEQTFIDVASRHGFGEIRTPTVEPTNLFVRTSGESSDIVHKELYAFNDRSDNSIALRPEGTAGVARAYLQHGLASRPQPVKLWYTANMYRYDRPQAGRYREHRQFGLEVFGSADPAVDAEVILAAWQVYQQLGLQNVSVQINSIGEVESRDKIRRLIVDTLSPHADQFSEDARRQLRDNPLRILDTKDPALRQFVDQVPPLVDHLTAEDRDHFTAVLEYLDQVGVAYELNPHLVRGLDYYTRTVFEFYGGAGGATSLGGGGRYDKLVEHLGGPPTPGLGMGNGLDRIVEEVKAQGTVALNVSDTASVFVIQLGDVAKKLSFELIDQLTRAGIGATSALGKDSIRSQLKLADKQGVAWALIIGQKEAMEGSLILRNMTSGEQENVPIEAVVTELQRRITT